MFPAVYDPESLYRSANFDRVWTPLQCARYDIILSEKKNGRRWQATSSGRI